MTSSRTDKDITIICVSYQRYREIHVLVNSMLCQTLQNWELLIIHDGEDAQMRDELAPYLEKYPQIKYMETETRYNDYGHSLRERGIELVDTPYLMMTNDDNYYVPRFLEIMFSGIRQHGLDFAYCDMVSSHSFKFVTKPSSVYTNVTRSADGSYFQAPYNVLRSEPRRRAIDIGNFIVKSKMAKSVGFKDKGFYADGLFVENLMDRYKKSIRSGKVNQVLFVHN